MKVIQSLDHNRTNPLSAVPGGSEISVTMSDGVVVKYDKIKSVAAYVKTAKKNPAVKLIKQGDQIIYKA